jgi:carboxyl-terminal processing protease
VRAGDWIVEVTRWNDAAGQPLATPETVALEGLSLEEVQRQILGPPGVKLALTVRRPGDNTTRTFEMQRAPVVQETVLGMRRKEDGSWDPWLDTDRKLAYVRIEHFSRDTAHELAAVLARLDTARGLVLDLRGCPGGLLVAVLEVASLFLDDQLVLTVRPRSGALAVFRSDRRDGKVSRLPLVVLVNGETASGAEVLAAALQDHKRATLIGERTLGRGSVQNLLTVGNRELRLTTAVFQRPSGRKLDRLRLLNRSEDEWGVRPDHEMELTLAERQQLREHLDRLTFLYPADRPYRPTFRDRQLERARQALN